MKCLIILLVVCGAIDFSEQALTKVEKSEMFLKMAKECSAKEGAQMGDLNDIFARKKPTLKAGKCVLACMGETLKIIKDNKVDVEESISLAKKAFNGNATKVEKFSQLTNGCAETTDADRCEAAAKIFQCGHNAAKSIGLSFEDV